MISSASRLHRCPFEESMFRNLTCRKALFRGSIVAPSGESMFINLTLLDPCECVNEEILNTNPQIRDQPRTQQRYH